MLLSLLTRGSWAAQRLTGAPRGSLALASNRERGCDVCKAATNLTAALRDFFRSKRLVVKYKSESIFTPQYVKDIAKA